MKQYIDKDVIMAEIKKRYEYWREKEFNSHSIESEIRMSECQHLMLILNNLEAKEEILDKSDKTKLMKKCVHKAYKRGYDMGVLQTTNKLNHDTKNIDLEKEIKEQITKYYNDCEQKLKEMDDNDNDFSFMTLDNFVKYFFELGLKTKGE